jgi:hypothetical protein
MGIAESTPSSALEDVVELYEGDPTYPWLPIIEYVADRLPNNLVRTYDFDAIREIVLEASIIPFNITKSTNNTIPKILDRDEIEFASALLQKDKKLKRMRYAYVPSILQEDIFWTLYFDRLYSRIREYLTRNLESKQRWTSNSAKFRSKEEGFLEVLSLKHETLRHIASVVLCPMLVLDAAGEKGTEGEATEHDIKISSFSRKRYNAIEKRHILKWFRSIDENDQKLIVIQNWFAGHKSTYRLGDYCAACYECFIRAYYGDLYNDGVDDDSTTTNIGPFESSTNMYKEMMFTIPVRGDPEKTNSKSTVGEFDILLLNKNDNKLYHEELSIKYMLFLRPNNNNQIANGVEENLISFNNYIGPHKSETLQDKVIKMERQSKLSEHPRGQDVVEKLFKTFKFEEHNKNVVTACTLKGWLFYPLKALYNDDKNKNRTKSINHNNNNKEYSDQMSLELTNVVSIEGGNKNNMETCTFVSANHELSLNEYHWFGWYTDSVDELNTIFSQNKSHRWVILPKLLWVAPLRVDGKPPESQERKRMKILFVPNELPNENICMKSNSIGKTSKLKLLTNEQLYGKINEQQENSRKEGNVRLGRILIAELRWDPYLYAWIEISRGFVVEKHWSQ